MRNKQKAKNTSPPPSTSFQVLLLSWHFCSSPLQVGQEDEEWRCRQCITLHLCHSFLITVFTCSGMNFLPGNTALYKHLQHLSFPWVAVLEELLQSKSCPWGTVLQRMDWSSTRPTWATISAGNLLQHGCPMGCSFLQEGTQLSLLYPSRNCRGKTCFTILYWLEMNLRSSTWSTTLPPSSLITAAA